MLGTDNGRADRIGALGSRQHCPHRPQARYQFGRSLSLRARGGPGFHAARPRARHQDGARSWRGRTFRRAVAGKVEVPGHSIDFPTGEVARLSGLHIDSTEVETVLGRLGFSATAHGGSLSIQVPSWRGDVREKADVVEEVVRIIGVDRIPATPFDRGEAPRRPVLTPLQTRRRKAARALAARGVVEAVTWSFIAHDKAAQ